MLSKRQNISGPLYAVLAIKSLITGVLTLTKGPNPSARHSYHPGESHPHQATAQRAP
jgi:hypothetical protein